MQSAYAGRYQIQVKRLDGSIKYESDWFDNLITNAGLDAKGGVRANTLRAWIGTGTTAAETDTSMTAVATTTSATETKSHNNSTAPAWAKSRYVFTFAVGAYVGTISDVGVGYGTGVASFTPLYSHAILPSPVTLGEIDQVILTYDHYYVGPSELTTYEFEINGIVTSTISKISYRSASSVDTFLGSLSSLHIYFSNVSAGSTNGEAIIRSGISTPSPNNLYSVSSGSLLAQSKTDNFTITTYTSGSYQRSYAVTFNAERGNWENINGVWLPFYQDTGTYIGAISKFDPAFTKSYLQKLTLNGVWSWARTTVPE